MFIELTLLFIFVFSIIYSASESNLFKKVIFINFSLTALIMLFVFHTFLFNGVNTMLSPFIIPEIPIDKFADPLPQALMLTAIVVGVATTSIFLAIIMKIKKYFGTIDQDEINEILKLSDLNYK